MPQKFKWLCQGDLVLNEKELGLCYNTLPSRFDGEG